MYLCHYLLIIFYCNKIMIGAIVGAGLSLASSIAGGISNAKKRREQRRLLEQQQRENQAWYDRRYNEDPTKRADTMRLLTQMNDAVKNRNQSARGRQAVMGGTEDSTTAVKEANNKTVADTTAQLVAANEARKDSIEQQYLQRKQQIQGQQMQMKSEDAANTANVVAGVAGTFANIANALDSGSGSGNNAKVAKPSVSASTTEQMSALDVKVGAVPNQHQVADELKEMVGDNAPKA